MSPSLKTPIHTYIGITVLWDQHHVTLHVDIRTLWFCARAIVFSLSSRWLLGKHAAESLAMNRVSDSPPTSLPFIAVPCPSRGIFVA